MVEGITRLLVKWSEGDKSALDQLIPLVYDELRRLASSHLRRHGPNQILEPTVIVHEAYLRLVDHQSTKWENRAQFFGMAATLMRNLLVDHSRREHAAKRGGNDIRLSLSQVDRFSEQPDVNVLALDDALTQLASVKPRHCRVVELRFFGGLTTDEAAEVLGVSPATVERDWSFAKAWLHRELSR